MTNKMPKVGQKVKYVKEIEGTDAELATSVLEIGGVYPVEEVGEFVKQILGEECYSIEIHEERPDEPNLWLVPESQFGCFEIVD